MKTLLLLGVLLPAAPVCDQRELFTDTTSATRELHRQLVAATQPAKTSTKQPSVPATPSSPAPKPAEKSREGRRARPEHLFL